MIAKKACYNISQKKFTDSPEEDSSNITDSLMLLAQTLSIIFKKKAIVIIDEYDVPLEKSRGKYYKSMVGFIRDLFSTTFKTNDFLEKGFLTGCLRVSRESIFTGFNNIPVYDCSVEKYSKLFGFTNEEVKQILEYYNLSKYFNYSHSSCPCSSIIESNWFFIYSSLLIISVSACPPLSIIPEAI